MEYEIWCRRLRQYRESRELTQEELALAVGLSRAHYCNIENGHTIINYKHLYNLAKVLRLKLEDLISFPMLRRKREKKKKTRST